MSDIPSAKSRSIPRSVKEPNSTKDLYFVQIEGGGKNAVEQVSDGLSDAGVGDNIIVTSDVIEPVDREEIKHWLSQLANALDMELKERD